jgi:hypothetical protein
MFRGRRGFGWSAALSALALLAAALPSPAPALVITADYSMLGAANAQQTTQIEAAFNTVIAQYEALFTNPVNVALSLQIGPGQFLGENLTNQDRIPYSNFRAALHSTASPGNAPAQTALLSMPTGSQAPIGGTSVVAVSTANAKALGFTESGLDSTVTISNSFSIQFARVNGHVATNSYDFITIAEHELNEVLGMGSALQCNANPCSASTFPNYISPEDLFRYDVTDVRSFNFSPSTMAYLSINGGGTVLTQLNQDGAGDYGDFFTPSSAPNCTAVVQDAFGCPNQVASVGPSSIETKLLAAMGWNPRFATAATSTNWVVDCAAGMIRSGGLVATPPTTVANPLAALLGSPSGPATFSPAPSPGDVVEITGLCVEDVTVRTSDLMLTNRQGPDGLAGDVNDADGVQGQLEIAGAQRIVIAGLLLGQFSPTPAFAFASASDLALLFIHDGATVTLLHSDVNNSPAYGVLARRGAQVTFLDDRFFYNGFSSGTPGIGILTNSKAMFGADDGSLPVLVQGSGGDGVVASVGSSVIFHAAHLTGNGNRQLFLQGASSARLSGSGVTVDLMVCQSTHGAPCNTAIEAVGSSMLRIEKGASVSVMDNGSLVGAIALSQGSSLLAQGATIETIAAPPTLAASDNSVIALAGGNRICNGTCDSGTTGTAVSVDHVSTLIQVAPAAFGYAAAQDTLFGNGAVQLQSTVDLGLGTIGPGGPPSLAWTTVSGFSSGVIVQQNSSFRIQGGVTITGPGGLKLLQGSNGFFNVANGGANSITGGVTCPFSGIAAAHVVGQTAVSPAVLLSNDFLHATSPNCLPF